MRVPCLPRPETNPTCGSAMLCHGRYISQTRTNLDHLAAKPMEEEWTTSWDTYQLCIMTESSPHHAPIMHGKKTVISRIFGLTEWRSDCKSDSMFRNHVMSKRFPEHARLGPARLTVRHSTWTLRYSGPNHIKPQMPRGVDGTNGQILATLSAEMYFSPWMHPFLGNRRINILHCRMPLSDKIKDE